MSHQRQLFADRFTAWQKFHADNPQVFEHFLRFARQAVAKRPGKSIGARLIWERLRWFRDFETESADEFAMNDHHVGYYARLAMQLYPQELGGLFETRDARFDATPSEILTAHLTITDSALSEAVHL